MVGSHCLQDKRVISFRTEFILWRQGFGSVGHQVGVTIHIKGTGDDASLFRQEVRLGALPAKQ